MVNLVEPYTVRATMLAASKREESRKKTASSLVTLLATIISSASKPHRLDSSLYYDNMRRSFVTGSFFAYRECRLMIRFRYYTISEMENQRARNRHLSR